MTRIHCFIPYGDPETTREIVGFLDRSPLVEQIYLLTNDPSAAPLPPARLLSAEAIGNTHTLRSIAGRAGDGYVLLYTRTDWFRPGFLALERMAAVAADSQAGLVYADYEELKNGEPVPHPVIDYQKGSLRDDFDFGPLLMYRAATFQNAVASMDKEYRFAGLYDLRLKVSREKPLVHINEYLYTVAESDKRKSGEKQFDYVDPRNRAVQLEMEAACTDHLKMIGAYLPPRFQPVSLDEASFAVEASVIIPVRNRARTIEDAIRSALAQQAAFPFNLIVIDNHSTDGTTEKIAQFATDNRLIHLRPERRDLGIGGCWNLGIHHPACGKFAIQLDSDDVYSGPDTIRKIVETFYAQNCAMVVGSYRMTDLHLQTLPPGVIDHREWTPENGRNNALRINGLGAPRAFFTPVIRQIGFPNTSYGEDYAVGLRISRTYAIGRIYDVLYLCRRWEDNSDAALSQTQTNDYNRYKDKLRTWELQARMQLHI